MRLRLIDLETSGLDPRQAPDGDGAEVCEIAFLDVDTFGTEIERYQTLVWPYNPIPPVARAVHHIGDIDVFGFPRWTQTILRLKLKPMPDVIVAHNSKFERQWIADIWPDARWLCTMKAAMRVWPDAPAFSNSVLRYWLDVDVPLNSLAPAHRAMGDCEVSASILRTLLEHTMLEKMISWENEPAMIPRITFGKHRGLKWKDVPSDYLKWMLSADFDADQIFCAEQELKTR
jgi:exodeoxyribonuclease X